MNQYGRAELGREGTSRAKNPSHGRRMTVTAVSNSDDEILRMEDISKQFGGLEALKGVDLILRDNEVLGLVGDNAAGKSTLMKILVGVYRADGGSIYFRGKPVEIESPQDAHELGIEIIYQDLALCNNMDVAENVLMGRWPRLWGFMLNRRSMEETTSEVLDEMGIDVQSVHQKVGELSGGKQQTVAIARAISFDPDVLIMDEPTANLSPEATDQVLQLVRRLKEQGMSIIIITHRMEEIFDVTDRISVLKHGEMVDTVDTSRVEEEDVLDLIISGRKRSA